MLLKYYQDNSSRRGSMWAPEAGSDTMEVHALHLLAIPLVLFEMIRKEGHPLMPYEVLQLVITHPETVKEKDEANTWQQIASWCLLVSQKNTQSNNWVAFLSR